MVEETKTIIQTKMRFVTLLLTSLLRDLYKEQVPHSE